MKFVWMVVFLVTIFTSILTHSAYAAPYPVVKELFKVTESIDDRHLAKKKLIEELEKELEKLGTTFVTEKKRAMDNIISKTGDVTKYSLFSRDVFAVYAYYALLGELPTNGISIYWQNLFSPLQQAKEGNTALQIQCYVGLVKLIKNSDGSAVCTTLETAIILVERNWGTSYDVELYHNIESVRNCEVGRYASSHGLGSFYIDIEKNEMGKCYFELFDEIEGGFSKKHCEISLDELQKFEGWEKGSWYPSFDGLQIDCIEKESGNLLGLFR